MDRLQEIKRALPILNLNGKLKEDIDWLIERVEQSDEEIKTLIQQRDIARSAPFYQCPNCMKKFGKHSYLEGSGENAI